MITVLSVVGTRPEAIKMAPVIAALGRRPAEIRSVLCTTGQHQEMLNQALDLFDLHADYDLGIMRPDQTLAELTARLFSALAPVVEDVKADWVLAQGDTTTVFVSAMTAYYLKTKFGHVEAGLRTGDRYNPFPEEINRRIADIVADLWFAPTEHSRNALLREGCSPARVILTGNTIVDALLLIKQMPYDWSAGPLAKIPLDRMLVVVTAHRRESFGAPLERICLAIRDLALTHGTQVHIVFPVHRNPNVRQVVYRHLADLDSVSLVQPLDYASMVQLMSRATLILTDSGGIQEEGPSLGVPVLVMRETTERPEGVWCGAVRLVGAERQRIVAEAEQALEEAKVAVPEQDAVRINPYGDGQAAQRVVEALLEEDW